MWSIWNSETRDDFALAYVRYGIGGESAIQSPPAPYLANPKAAATLSYYELFREPLNRRISAATNGILPVASIRRLLHLKSPFKFTRVILMWLLRKWDSFRPRQAFCHRCLCNYSSLIVCCGETGVFNTIHRQGRQSPRNWESPEIASSFNMATASDTPLSTGPER